MASSNGARTAPQPCLTALRIPVRQGSAGRLRRRAPGTQLACLGRFADGCACISQASIKTRLDLSCRNGLIAINYAARAAGVTRHMKVQEAKKACPGLIAVHVEVLGALRPCLRSRSAPACSAADRCSVRDFFTSQLSCSYGMPMCLSVPQVPLRPSLRPATACCRAPDVYTMGRRADENGTVDERLVEDALREGNHATEAGSSNKGKACLERCAAVRRMPCWCGSRRIAGVCTFSSRHACTQVSQGVGADLPHLQGVLPGRDPRKGVHR